ARDWSSDVCSSDLKTVATEIVSGDFRVDAEVDVESLEASARKARLQGLKRLLRYSALKLVALVFTVAVGVYITILVANMGGEVDKMRLATIRESVALAATADPAFKVLNSEERREFINARVDLEVRRYGLDRPFIVRSFEYLKDGLTLNLGFSQQLLSDSGSRQVRNILLERLPATLLLLGTANLLLFFLALFAG